MADPKPKRNKNTFQPGQSGNPAGRKKAGLSITEVLRGDAQVVLKKFGKRQNKIGTRAQLVSEILWDMALRGNLKAIELILDRLDGKPITPLHHTGDPTLSLIIERDASHKPDHTDTPADDS
jgi:hypothetical protein